MKKLLLLTAVLFVLTSCLSSGPDISYEEAQKIVIPDYTKFQPSQVYIFRSGNVITTYSTKPVLTPYYSIPVVPPPVTYYIY